LGLLVAPGASRGSGLVVTFTPGENAAVTGARRVPEAVAGNRFGEVPLSQLPPDGMSA